MANIRDPGDSAPKFGVLGTFLEDISLQHIWKPEKMADPHDSTFTEDLWSSPALALKFE